MWIKRLCGWLQHVARHPTSWPARLLKIRDSGCLQEKSAMFTGARWSLHAGRTDTKSVPGFVPRYEDGCRRWSAASGKNYILGSNLESECNSWKQRFPETGRPIELFTQRN